MDPHGLTQGRTMLIVRGAIGIVFGIIASNQPGVSAGGLVTLFGLWALAEGAATVRQAYSRVDESRNVEARPILLVLGGVALVAGVLALLGLGLSTGALLWAVAAWLAVRIAFEGLAAYGAPSTRVRVFFVLAAAVDVALVALLATHTSGSVVDVALVGGGAAAVWGALHLMAGFAAARILVLTPVGPRLLG